LRCVYLYGKPEAVLLTEERLSHWQVDPDLAGVRDARSLAALTEPEQAAWRKLWADVDQLLKQVRAGITKTTLKGELTAKQREQPHPLKMAAGKTYVIDMESPQFDTYLRLVDDKGKVLAENDDISPQNQNSRVVFTAPADGIYSIVATSFERRGTGVYTLTIREVGGKAK
jgi:hypothetical protein